jgi:hypothetical protein
MKGLKDGARLAKNLLSKIIMKGRLILKSSVFPKAKNDRVGQGLQSVWYLSVAFQAMIELRIELISKGTIPRAAKKNSFAKFLSSYMKRKSLKKMYDP